jgi:esterase FrsA
MSYTYDLSPATSFEDRYSQFIAFGIPKADVDTLRTTIKDMWADAPGGWSYEWSAFARKYLEAGNPLLASFAYGFAIFPCLATDARRKAQQNQLECYLKAAQSFPVKFERRMLAIPTSVEVSDELFSETPVGIATSNSVGTVTRHLWRGATYFVAHNVSSIIGTTEICVSGC